MFNIIYFKVGKSLFWNLFNEKCFYFRQMTFEHVLNL